MEVIPKRKMTRQELVITIARLQDHMGKLWSCVGDRNPNRYAEVVAECEEAFDLCVLALGGYPPVSPAAILRHQTGWPVRKRTRI